jgi:hypothetical protein
MGADFHARSIQKRYTNLLLPRHATGINWTVRHPSARPLYTMARDGGGPKLDSLPTAFFFLYSTPSRAVADETGVNQLQRHGKSQSLGAGDPRQA